MPIFPRIQSPCPYKSDLAAVMDGDMCRACNRTVFDLSAMDDGERLAFLAGCEEEVCVSYRIPIRPAMAAAALAAAAMSVPASAQDIATPAIEAVADMDVAAEVEAMPGEEMDIFVGGIKDPKTVELVDTDTDTDTSGPELPILYEDPATPLTPATGGPAGT